MARNPPVFGIGVCEWIHVCNQGADMKREVKLCKFNAILIENERGYVRLCRFGPLASAKAMKSASTQYGREIPGACPVECSA
jgi:hypothetical protein